LALHQKIQVKLFTPTKKQSEFISQIQEDQVKYIILTTGRQFGKTMMAQNLALKWGLENPNSEVMWVSPIYSQARKVFESIANAIEENGLVKSVNKSNLEILFVNGSIMRFKSGERPDGLRGYTLDYLIIDEAAFIKDDVWNQVLKATILVKGKKILFISTPKGKNYLYSLSLRAQDENNKQYIHLKGTSFDSPFISVDELIEAQKTLPTDIYKQEILGEFIDDGGEVFKDVDRYCTAPNWQAKVGGKKYYAGIDFGRMDDYTVLTILDQDANMVFQYRDSKKPWQEMVGNIVKYLKQYEPTAFIEVNSIGDVLFEQIQKDYRNIEPFITSNSSKKDIIEDLILGLNEGKLVLPNESLCSALYNELKSFTYTYSPRTRNIIYGASQGAHDDTIMSLAMAYNALKNKQKKGVYHIY